MPVGDVECIDRGRKTLAEIFAQRQVDSGMGPEVVRGRLPVGEARPVVNVGRSERTPGKAQDTPYIQRVALIVVERRETLGKGEIGQTPGNSAPGQGYLIGIG